MEKISVIKACHVNVINRRYKIKKIIVNPKEFYWEIPDNLKGKLNKGDLVCVNVENKLTPKGELCESVITKSFALIIDVINDFKNEEALNLKKVRCLYKGKKARLVKEYIKLGMINEDVDESILKVKKLASKCNLSEKSINGLLKKYSEEKVEKAIDMFLATEEKKAPLKFLKFILEQI
ncbi:DUF5839 family protein [Clostridium sp.]|uniref:DUF5839 family protein n=2 Tax=Clostridium sp. TaxID=1506 RepID=UPI0039938BC1